MRRYHATKYVNRDVKVTKGVLFWGGGVYRGSVTCLSGLL